MVLSHSALSGKQRGSNVNKDSAGTELLQTTIDTLRGTIAMKDAEYKKIKESDIIKSKRIMNLESQLKETQKTLILQNHLHSKEPANNDA